MVLGVIQGASVKVERKRFFGAFRRGVFISGVFITRTSFWGVFTLPRGAHLPSAIVICSIIAHFFFGHQRVKNYTRAVVKNSCNEGIPRVFIVSGAEMDCNTLYKFISYKKIKLSLKVDTMNHNSRTSNIV